MVTRLCLLGVVACILLVAGLIFIPASWFKGHTVTAEFTYRHYLIPADLLALYDSTLGHYRDTDEHVPSWSTRDEPAWYYEVDDPALRYQLAAARTRLWVYHVAPEVVGKRIRELQPDTRLIFVSIPEEDEIWYIQVDKQVFVNGKRAAVGWREP